MDTSQDKSNIFGRRLKEMRKYLGISQDYISRTIGVPMKTYQNWERGINEPQASIVTKMATLMGVDLIWLLTGEGAINNRSLEDIRTESNPIEKECPAFIPLLGPAGAGPHGFTVSGDFAREWVPCPYGLEKRKSRLFGFTVSGMSMYPKFRDGDVVVCERKEPYYPAIDDEVVVMLTRGFETMVKLWRRDGELISLESYNDRIYAPIKVAPEHVKDKAKVIDVIWGSRLKEMSYMQPDDLPNGNHKT